MEKSETTKSEVQLENKTFKSNSNPINEKPFIPKKQNKVAIIGIIFLCIVIALLTALIIFSIFTLKSNTIAKGISIKGIDVSGLHKVDARAKVANYINNSFAEEIPLKHNDFDTSLSTTQLGIFFNVDKAIETAYNIGKTGNIFQKDYDIIKALINKPNIDVDFTIDDKLLKHDLTDISSKLPDKVVESSYYIDGNNLVITKGQSGQTIKIDESANYIKTQINNLNVANPIELFTEDASPKKIDIDAIYNEIHKDPVNAYYTQDPYVIHPSENGMDFAITVDQAKALLQEDKDEYTIPVKVVYPSVTTNMIGQEAFPDLLSNFSTKYATSNKGRTTNLILAANKINGTVLMPGETFSYNKVVGARTIAAGYKEAPIYVSGRVENGLGGGICQIASTLYDAAVYANLDIVERSNHQFVPSYIGASRDATVVYGAIDFKFKNNRDYPIKITCSVSGGIANFKIWGLKSDNDYQVEISSRITNRTSSSIYSEAYKILKKNGVTVNTVLLSKDVYKRH